MVEVSTLRNAIQSQYRSAENQKTLMSAKTSSVDFTVDNQGTLFILRGVSDAAKEWIEKNIQAEDYQKFGGCDTCIVVEHRYIQDIINGMEAEGFVGANA